MVVKYCTNCGEKLNDDGKCMKCDELIELNEDNNVVVDSVKVIEKGRKKTALLGGIFSIVFLIIFYIIGNVCLSESNYLSKFEKAINDRDVERLKTMISIEGCNLNSKTLEPLFEYAKNNPKSIEELLKSKEDSSPFTLIKNGKKFIFFNDYKMQIGAMYLRINVSEKDTELYINGEKVDNTDENVFSKEYGPFVPGTYEVKAVKKGNYGDIIINKKLDLVSASVEAKKLDIDYNNNYVYINSDYDDAKIYVNGTDAGITVGGVGKFGPVSLDGSVGIYAVKTVNSRVFKSDVVTLTEKTKNDVYLSFGSSKSEIESMKQTTPTYVVVNDDDCDSYHYMEDYIIPNSDIVKLSSSSISGFTKYELKIARNEIYARHGHVFKDAQLRDYFRNKPWYRENPSFNDNSVSSIEKYNINLIKGREDSL